MHLAEETKIEGKGNKRQPEMKEENDHKEMK
jgi:hypothetical protein